MNKNMTDKELLKSLGAKLRIAREKKGLRMRDVGMIADIYFSHISLIERGETSARITTIKMLADVYEINIKDLF